MKMKSMLVVMVVMFVGLLFSTGCATPQYQQNQNAFNQGAIGALIGGVAGAVIGNNSHGAFGNGEGAVAGAALGGLLGGAMGHQKDQFGRQIGAVNETASTTIINVNNSNGSVTPVVIRKVGNQYMGPRGEYYNSIPTEQQLKSYGF
jgi:hypothetical protein